MGCEQAHGGSRVPGPAALVSGRFVVPAPSGVVGTTAVRNDDRRDNNNVSHVMPLSSVPAPSSSSVADRYNPALADVVKRYLDVTRGSVLSAALGCGDSDHYFRSPWNRFDFCMLLIALVGVAVPSAGSGLAGLRSLRTLRPLRAFRFFAPLQAIVVSLWRSIRPLVGVTMCLMFFFTFFSLLGQQFFEGALMRRCVVPQGQDALRFNVLSPSFPATWAQVRQSPDAGPSNYSVYYPETWCSFESDPRSFQCSDLGVTVSVSVEAAGVGDVTVPLVCVDVGNPSMGMEHFDTFGGAMYSVFVIASLQVWSQEASK